MALGKKVSRIQVIVDGYEVELRTPEGEMLRGAVEATLHMHAGERPTVDVTFVMPSVAADVAVNACWLECPLCGSQRLHHCEDEDEDGLVKRPEGTVWTPGPSFIAPAVKYNPASVAATGTPPGS